MKILVINSGSSSLKFQVIDTDTEEVLAKGQCERIGIDGVFNYQTGGGIKIKETCPMKNHKEGWTGFCARWWIKNRGSSEITRRLTWWDTGWFTEGRNLRAPW